MNCFFYRKPGGESIYSGCSDEIFPYMSEGFIFSPFGFRRSIFTIPAQRSGITEIEAQDIIAGNTSSFMADIRELHSTNPTTHYSYISDIKDFLKLTEERLAKPTKIVAARVDSVSSSLSPLSIFHNLCRLQQNAFVFLFSTPAFGTWIGASPEVILQCDGSSLLTYSLAGSRPASDKDSGWDAKNIEEQQIVTDFIIESLTQEGLSPNCSKSTTLRCGAVEHLLTEIHVNLGELIDHDTPERLITSLTPTPALSGFPQKEAIDFITSHEGFPRLCYGGMVGYCYGTFNFSAYVNLRSGMITDAGGSSLMSTSLLLYAGGGITLKSVAEEEWLETERKLSTMRSALI